jgi:hypothetical protein
MGLFEVMMMPVRVLCVLVVTVVAGACAGALPKANTSVFPDGTYQFYEHAAGVTTDFRGRVRVAGDSIEVIEASPACIEQPVHSVDPDHVQAFRCGEFALNASRRGGRWVFGYATQRTVQDEVQTCAIYETIAGRQVCTKNHTERRERLIPLSGTLRLSPVAADSSRRSGMP